MFKPDRMYTMFSFDSFPYQTARFIYHDWRTTSSPSEMIKKTEVAKSRGTEKSRKANPHAQISP